MRYDWNRLRIREFEWDEENEEHVALHGVSPDEVEEALRQRPYLRRGRSRKYWAYGMTADGRHLFVIFALKRGGTVRVITARDMTRRERKAYRRRRK